MPNPANPQSLNRYSYCLNNPLRYTDPSGHGQGYADPDKYTGTEPLYGYEVNAGRLFPGAGMVTVWYPESQVLKMETNNPFFCENSSLVGMQTTFEDMRIYARRPNILSLIGGCRFGMALSSLELSGKAFLTINNDATRVILSIGVKYYGYTPEDNVRIWSADPVLICKTAAGKQTFHMQPQPLWDIARKDAWSERWETWGTDIPAPRNCTAMYISFECYIPSDKRSIEQGPAYLEPYGLMIDLKSGKVQYLSTPKVRV